MQPASRASYALEEIWGGKTARVRLAPASRAGHRAAGRR
jgi:hypothetical protein